jgi:photosystem II stability/assembly factor-like uncharacterized protein
MKRTWRIAWSVLPVALAASCLALPATAVTAATAATVSSASPDSTPVPTGFVAQSTSWISPSQGWVLGTEICGKVSNCTTSQVIGTTNGGATWSEIGPLNAQIPKMGQAGTGTITEISFASASIGWGFGPGLYHTANGGKTWQTETIPGGGKQVLDLAVTKTAAYMVVSPCAYATGICGSKPLTTWRTSLASTTWTKMPVTLHANVNADVSASGNAVYLVNQRLDGPNHPSQLYVSTNGGTSFRARHVPCGSQSEFNLVQAAAYSATGVGFLCDGDPGFGKAVKTVYLSENNGKTDSNAGTMGLYGIQAELAISPSRNLAVESWSIGSFIYINDNHGKKWYMIIGSGDGGAGFNDITYVSGREAWVVYGPADGFSGYGQIYKTANSGRKWQLVNF